MKVKLKPYIRDTNHLNIPGYQHLTKDKWYEAEFIYIPYIIKCDDGRIRKFPPALFITKEEWRDLQLEKLL